LISPVLDESGFAFDLLYSEAYRRFMYVLQERAQLPERLVRLESSLGLPHQEYRLWIGAVSGFVFAEDIEEGCLVLIAISGLEVLRNHYFDGPFDQVPPKLSIRDVLYEAYPYTQIGAGLDENGVFLGVEGVRVAISPYFTYGDVSEAISHFESSVDFSRAGLARVLPVIKEDKNTFHERLNEFQQEPRPAERHLLEASRLWPAGHLFEKSTAGEF
jgi:hypothetical protein